MLVPSRRRISVLCIVIVAAAAVIVVIIAVRIRTEKFVNHLTNRAVFTFQRVRVHCRSLPNTRRFVLMPTVLLRDFYTLQTIFSNVAARQLDDGR